MFPIKFDSKNDPSLDNSQKTVQFNEQKLDIQRIERYHEQQMQMLELQKKEMRQKMFYEPQSAKRDVSKNLAQSSGLRTHSAATAKNEALNVTQKLKPISNNFEKRIFYFTSILTQILYIFSLRN
jgi:hypothetical protein